MSLEQHEWVIPFSDVKRLYISLRSRLIKAALLGALLAFLFISLQLPKYRAEAVFKEGVEQSHSESLLKELMGGLQQTHQPQAGSFMRSHQVLKPLVEKLGLQIYPAHHKWPLTQRIWENIKAEGKLPLSDVNSFIFENASYDGDEKCLFYLRFFDETHFAVYNSKKEELARGVLGEPIFHFTLIHAPQTLKVGTFYPFEWLPWQSVVSSLQKELSIKNDKDNESLIRLSYAHRDRHLASAILNELMSQYQAYLKREYDHVAKSQIAYLENKQEQILGKMENLFDQHRAYLSKNLNEYGFVGIEEFHALLAPYQEMNAKLSAIDLELSQLDKSDSIRHLFPDYNAKLDASEATMRIYDKLKKEIANPAFELSSLSLKDPFSEKIIREAAELAIQLKDEKHHSTKEEARWKEQLSFLRNVLSDHLSHLHQVEELNMDLVQEKITESLKEKRQALLSEKALLLEKMEKMRAHLAQILPEKWRSEKWLTMQSDLIGKITETLTQTVESKTITAHLHHIESKPLDQAPVPLLPRRPKLLQVTLLGSLLFPFFLFTFTLFRYIFQGFPTSLEKLKALNLPTLGYTSSDNLDFLRRLSLFADRKVIGLITGLGPDYSYALAENLSRSSTKSIVVRCDFLSQQTTPPGLLQLNENPPIQTLTGFDLISTGGYSPFGSEIIQSPPFLNLLDHLKKNYDRIFLVFRSSLTSAESLVALKLCEKAIVTVTEESTEELTPFIGWAYHNEDCRLTFIKRT